MSDVNFASISGRLARKPELRTTPSGVAVTDITVANNLYSKTGKEKTTYFRCTVWNKSAEFAVNQLDKGDHVMVTGQMVDDNYIPAGTEQSTRGRIKMDNCRLTVLHRKNSNTTLEQPTDDDINPDMSIVDNIA